MRVEILQCNAETNRIFTTDGRKNISVHSLDNWKRIYTPNEPHSAIHTGNDDDEEWLLFVKALIQLMLFKAVLVVSKSMLLKVYLGRCFFLLYYIICVFVPDMLLREVARMCRVTFENPNITTVLTPKDVICLELQL